MNLSISLEQPGKKLALFGSADRHLRLIRDTFEVQVVNRDDQLRLSGEAKQVSKAAKVLDHMQRKLRGQDWLTVEDVAEAIGAANGQTLEKEKKRGTGDHEEVEVFTKGQSIRPKTNGQKGLSQDHCRERSDHLHGTGRDG